MSVIAFDGVNIVSDRMAVRGTRAATVTKLVRCKKDNKNIIFGITGTLSLFEALKKWYLDGADANNFIKVDDRDSFDFIVVENGAVFFYEDCQYPLFVEDNAQAWGCGASYAITAMDCGKTAIEAVEITNKFDVYCGNGFVSFKIDETL